MSCGATGYLRLACKPLARRQASSLQRKTEIKNCYLRSLVTYLKYKINNTPQSWLKICHQDKQIKRCMETLI